LGPITSAGRALGGTGDRPKEPEAKSWDRRGREARRLADLVYGVHFFCPEGGKYLLSPDGKVCQCSVHGSALAPRQSARPNKDGPLGKLVEEFAGMTATLTFTQDGLYAVVTIDRK
jgi:hypothetical protein